MHTLNKRKYAFFDADNVGESIEILLRRNQIEEAIELSSKIKFAFQEIEKNIRSNDNVEVLISAGDDLLVEINFQSASVANYIDEIRKLFFDYTGLSLSCGVGDIIPDSVQNLYLAKLYGKNQIIGV